MKTKILRKATKSVALITTLSLLVLSLSCCFTFTASAADLTDFQIKIVHTNDIHARVTENEKSAIIGVEKLKSVIDSYTEGADMDLVLDSGDLFHGQAIATLVQGESIAELVKVCGYDAMTAGNHDWSYGKDRLKELSAMAGLTMLTGNVVDEDGNKFFDDEFYTEEVTKNGQTLKVGIFGVIDPDIYSKTTPSNVEGLTFTNSAEYAKSAAAELEKQGCDVVIALTHTYNPEQLAEQVDGVDLWLCGHEHVDINSTVTTPDGSTAYVIEDGYYLYEAGLIELDCALDTNGDVSISCEKTVCDYAMAAEYENNADATAALDKINSDLQPVLSEVVGETPCDLDGVWENLRVDETKLGKAVASAYLLVTGADVAFENAGGIRASIAEGDVTYGDIIGVSPYGNYIVTKQVTGAQLKEMIETTIGIQKNSVAANDSGDNDAWPENSGSYLQTAGIEVKYDLNGAEGSRVQSIKVNGEDLDEDMLYTVATNNYVAVSDTYTQLAEADEIGQFSSCDEALIKFFSQDTDVIEESLSAVGMIKVDTTYEETDEADETADEVAEEATDEIAESNDEAADKGAENPDTGVGSSLAVIFVISGAVMCAAKKRSK